MRRSVTDLADPAFQSEFAAITRSWFRLETLQEYSSASEREELRAFLAGEPKPPETEPEAAWTAMIAAHVAAGRRLQRVHVVEEPPSAYIEYELSWAYAAGIAGGEKIQIAAVQRAEWPADLPHEDFWIFDEARVWRMEYDANGYFLGAELIDRPSEVAQYLSWQSVALESAIPLANYLARNQLGSTS